MKLFNRDKLSTPVGRGVLAGIMEMSYIVLVVVFMMATESLMKPEKPGIMVAGMLVFLGLLVLSVAITGVLVFVWPAYYFIEKKYKESLYAFLGTAVTIFVIFAIVFLSATIVSLF
jgi:hypothetical protein